MAKKPPLGVMPEIFWNERRQQDLTDAIGRYAEVKKPVPVEWFDEHARLRKRLNYLRHGRS